MKEQEKERPISLEQSRQLATFVQYSRALEYLLTVGKITPADYLERMSELLKLTADLFKSR